MHTMMDRLMNKFAPLLAHPLVSGTQSLATTVAPTPTTTPVVSGQVHPYRHLVDVPGLTSTGAPDCFDVYTVTGSRDAPDLSSGSGTGAGAGPWRKGHRLPV